MTSWNVENGWAPAKTRPLTKNTGVPSMPTSAPFAYFLATSLLVPFRIDAFIECGGIKADVSPPLFEVVGSEPHYLFFPPTSVLLLKNLVVGLSILALVLRAFRCHRCSRRFGML